MNDYVRKEQQKFATAYTDVCRTMRYLESELHRDDVAARPGGRQKRPNRATH